MDYLNMVKIGYEEIKDKNRLFRVSLDSCIKATLLLKDEVRGYKSEVAIKDSLITLQGATIIDMKISLTGKDKYIKNLRLQKAIIGTTASAIIVFLSYLLIVR